MKAPLAILAISVLLLSPPAGAATPAADAFLNYACTANLSNVPGSASKFTIRVRGLAEGEKFGGSSREAIDFGGHLPVWFVMSRQRIKSGRAILSGWIQVPSKARSGTYGGGLDPVHPFVFATIQKKQAVVICDLVSRGA